MECILFPIFDWSPYGICFGFNRAESCFFRQHTSRNTRCDTQSIHLSLMIKGVCTMEWIHWMWRLMWSIITFISEKIPFYHDTECLITIHTIVTMIIELWVSSFRRQYYQMTALKHSYFRCLIEYSVAGLCHRLLRGQACDWKHALSRIMTPTLHLIHPVSKYYLHDLDNL